MVKVCYCLALRPPVGPMHIPELTLRLLEPLGVFSKFVVEIIVVVIVVVVSFPLYYQ